MKKELIRISTWTKLNQAIKEAPIVIIENGQGTKEEIYQLTQVLNGNIDNRIFNNIRTLKVEDTLNKSVGSSNDPHPPHTDGCYTPNPSTHIVLQCVRPDRKKGGLGLFWTLQNYFKNLPKDYYNILRELPITYSRQREDGKTVDKYEGFILQEQESYYGKTAIRWRYDQRLRPIITKNVSSKERKLFDDAVAFTINYFQTEQPIIVPYKKGDLIIASNRYLTHGRTRILDHNRIMRRAWFQVAN